MRDIRVAMAQIAPALGDVEANVQRHLDVLARARGDGADLVVFPELSLTGYLLADQVPDVALPADGPELRTLADTADTTDVIVGFVEEAPGHRFHNAAAYLSGGHALHVHRKVYLPTYGMFQEGRDLAAGDVVRAFDTPLGRFGMMICEDLWHASCAWLLAQQGAEAMFVLSNGPTRGTRPGEGITSVGVWRDLLRVTAQFQTGYMVYVNRVGGEDGLTFGGGSMTVDPFGRVACESPALDEALDTVELRDETLRRARTAYPLLRDERLELVHRETGRLRRVRYDLPAEGSE